MELASWWSSLNKLRDPSKRWSSWPAGVDSERVIRQYNTREENIIVRMSGGKVRERPSGDTERDMWGDVDWWWLVVCTGWMSTLLFVFRDNYWSIITVRSDSHTTSPQDPSHRDQILTLHLTSALGNIHILHLYGGLTLLMRRLLEYMNISINLFDNQ